MDFINLATEFQNHIKEKRLSCGQIALYYALLNIANSSSEDWFSICDEDLQAVCGLSRQGLHKAKNVLKQYNLIDFTKGNGKKAPKYRLFCECTSECTTQCTTQCTTREEDGVSSSERVRADACDNSNIYNNKINKNTSTTTEESEYSGIENGTIPQSATLTAPSRALQGITQGSQSGGGGLKCISAYEQNIGVITPRAAEIFIEYIDAGLEDELICLCIDEAVRANVRNLNYIDKIILNCQSEGIKTAAAFRARTERKRKGNTPHQSATLTASPRGEAFGGWEGVKEL